MTEENRILIDRYLGNSLTGVELKEFLDKLELDDNFKKEVSFHNLLIEGIQYAEDMRRMNSINKFIGYRKPKIPFALKLIFTFFLITMGGIVLWNYIDPDSTGLKHDYFTLDFFRKNRPDSITQLEVKNRKALGKKAQQPSGSSSFDSSNFKINDSYNKTPTFNHSDSTEIIVKKDLLLISIMLKPIDIDEKKIETVNTESSITKNTIDKLNPSAGLPENEIKITTEYKIEFWVSPVNYIGYKLVNDVLILFGIEEPDAVMLYSGDNKLWMKYGQDYYYLQPSIDFEALIKTNEIPSALK